jgi:hypothetical protein
MRNDILHIYMSVDVDAYLHATQFDCQKIKSKEKTDY